MVAKFFPFWFVERRGGTASQYGYPDGQGEQTWLGGAHTQNATTPNTVENDTSQYQLCNRCCCPKPPSEPSNA